MRRRKYQDLFEVTLMLALFATLAWMGGLFMQMVTR